MQVPMLASEDQHILIACLVNISGKYCVLPDWTEVFLQLFPPQADFKLFI